MWAQTGPRAYAQTFVAPVYDVESGATVGQATVAGTLTLDDAGGAWAGPHRISIVDPDGAVLFRSPVLTVRATRVRLQPLT